MKLSELAAMKEEMEQYGLAVKKDMYGRVPARMFQDVKDKLLTPRDVLVFSRIDMNNEWWYTRQRQLAESLGMGKSRVGESISKLNQLGYLETENVVDEQGRILGQRHRVRTRTGYDPVPERGTTLYPIGVHDPSIRDPSINNEEAISTISADEGAELHTPSEVVDHWNKIAKKVGMVEKRKLTPELSKKIATRLKDPDWFDEFKSAVEFLSQSLFHTGKDPKTFYRANLELVLRKGNTEKYADLNKTCSHRAVYNQLAGERREEDNTENWEL